MPVTLIPRDLLSEAIARNGAEHLDTDIRSFLETRFRTDLRDVRIHTTVLASQVCDMMEARAMTVGDDILFAEGAYAPRTQVGLRLLAHELVHVLQQRAEGGPAFAPRALQENLAVGDARDPLESEADLLVNEVLQGGLRSRITPDSSGVVRRAITVLDGTATMTTSAQGTTPGVDYAQRGSSNYTRMAVLHLTRNSKGLVKGTARRPNQAAAIRVTGTVTVKADPKNTIDDIKSAYSFHFVQVFYELSSFASYAGEVSSDGCMTLHFAGPTNYAGYGKFVADFDPDKPAQIPYADTYSGLAQTDPKNGMWMATVIIDDHPIQDYPLVLPNFAASNRDNYLYRVGRQFHVITTLVVVDVSTGFIRPLAYVDWGALCVAKLPWKLNKDGVKWVDAPQIESSYWLVGQWGTGAPTNRGVAPMVTNPTQNPDDAYLRLAQNARAAVIMSTANSQDVDAAAVWSSSVPPSHFK